MKGNAAVRVTWETDTSEPRKRMKGLLAEKQVEKKRKRKEKEKRKELCASRRKAEEKKKKKATKGDGCVQHTSSSSSL